MLGLSLVNLSGRSVLSGSQPPSLVTEWGHLFLVLRASAAAG